MEKDDIDDVFEDFGNKVTNKNETHHSAIKEAKHHTENISEGGVLKKKYQSAEKALKDKYKEEKEALQKKKAKEMLSQGIIPTKNLTNIERIGYIAIIIVLLVYAVIDLSFYHGSDVVEIGEDDTITAAAIDLESTEEETEVITEEPEEESEPVAEEVQEKKLSGVVLFVIDKINTEVVNEDNDFGYISSIIFTVDNGKNKDLRPIIEVFAFDSKLDESWETRVRGKYIGTSISPGGRQTGTINLVPKSFKNLDLEKNIRLVLNDTRDGFIKVINKDVIIS